MSDMIDRDAVLGLMRNFRTKAITSEETASSVLNAAIGAIRAIPAAEVGVKPLAYRVVDRRTHRSRIIDAAKYDPTGPAFWLSQSAMDVHEITPLYPAVTTPPEPGRVAGEAAPATNDPAKVLALVAVESHWGDFIQSSLAEAGKAMRKFPQPNYVISKVAEEAGEVVKAAIHCAEGRETAENVRAEMRQLIAMLYRLWVEGDQVHGLPPVSALAAFEKEGEGWIGAK